VKKRHGTCPTDDASHQTSGDVQSEAAAVLWKAPRGNQRLCFYTPAGFFQDMNDRLRLLRILGDQRPSVRDARRTVMVILGDLRPSGRDARPSKKEVRNSDGRLAEKDVLQRSRVLRSEAAAVALLRPHIL